MAKKKNSLLGGLSSTLSLSLSHFLPHPVGLLRSRISRCFFILMVLVFFFVLSRTFCFCRGRRTARAPAADGEWMKSFNRVKLTHNYKEKWNKSRRTNTESIQARPKQSEQFRGRSMKKKMKKKKKEWRTRRIRSIDPRRPRARARARRSRMQNKSL